MNPDVKTQLAAAFGLAAESEVDALLGRLRSGADVDPALLRRAVLALAEQLGSGQADHADRDRRVGIALDAAQVGLWDWDLVTRDLFVDHTYFALLGQPAEDRVQPLAAFESLVHPDDLEPFRKATDDVVRGKSALLQFQHRVRHADGRWVWIETCGSVTARDANGRVTRMTGTQTDITERKQLERALSNTLRVMRALLETLPLPVVIRDAERRMTMVNAAWEQMMSMSRDAILGRRLDSLPNLPAPRGYQESDDVLFREKKPQRYESNIRAADGTVYDVIVAKTPLFAEDGSVSGIASVITDISEQNRTAAALEQARRQAEAAMHAKSRFLANMSHELRTPLNGVVGMASLLENTALDAKQRRFVRTLKTSAEALVTLINDVLDLSKAEAGKLELSHAPFELRREIDQVVSLFSARSHDKGLDLVCHIARDVPPVIHGDAIRLRQVLGNLINNAIKFTESGAVLVTVGTVPGPGPTCQLEFAVTDTGMGVAISEQQRIFDAFEQADGSVTRKFGGTGLGLAICRQLVELMKGSIGMSSNPGHGSRFHFRIPAHVPKPVPPAAHPADDLAAVVIGVHAAVQAAVTDALRAECSSVVHVDSAAAAIEAFAALGARVRRLRVLLDANATARMDQAVSALRAAAASRALEIIALLPPDADATPPPGVTRSLVKPLCTLDLCTAVPAVDTAQSARVRALPTSGSRGRALVVEDNAVNQEMARAMLDMLGFHVVTASNGQEGVAAAAADPALNLIFMDCQMPVMDGLSAARAIRAAESAGRRIPIVALTGNAMSGDREACLAAGMDDYLAKPFSLTALRAVVDKWVPGRPAG